MGDEIYAEWENDERVAIIHFLNDIGQPYSCLQWGNYGTIGIPPIVGDDIGEVSAWFENPNGNLSYGALILFIDHTMTVAHIMSASPSFNVANAIIENLLNDIPDNEIYGCTNADACNYDELATDDDGSCLADDCAGICGGPGLDDECGTCNDPVCNSSETPSPFSVGENPCQLEGEYPISTLWNSTCDLSLLSNNILPPNHFKINNLFPNPFNPVLNIDFDINQEGWVKVNIADITGSMVKTIYEGYEGVGKHHLSWDSDKLPSGTYFVTLEFENLSLTRKVVLLK